MSESGKQRKTKSRRARKAVEPGRALVPDPAGAKAPHISVQVSGKRGKGKQITPAEKDEATTTLRALENNAQLSRSGKLEGGQTHSLESDGSGNPRLVRKRFSAL